MKKIVTQRLFWQYRTKKQEEILFTKIAKTINEQKCYFPLFRYNKKCKWNRRTEKYLFPHFGLWKDEKKKGPKLAIYPLSVQLLRKTGKWTETYEFPHFRPIYLEKSKWTETYEFPHFRPIYLEKSKWTETYEFPHFRPIYLEKSKWTETYEFPHFRPIYLGNYNRPKCAISPLWAHLLNWAGNIPNNPSAKIMTHIYIYRIEYKNRWMDTVLNEILHTSK